MNTSLEGPYLYSFIPCSLLPSSSNVEEPEEEGRNKQYLIRIDVKRGKPMKNDTNLLNLLSFFLCWSLLPSPFSRLGHVFARGLGLGLNFKCF
jgi:hypothetical protein